VLKALWHMVCFSSSRVCQSVGEMKSDNQITIGTRCFLVVGLLHLLVALAGALGFHYREGKLGRFIDGYSVLSGADRQWGFFSNDSRTENRISFDVIDGAGTHSQHCFEEGANREEMLRINDMMARLWGMAREKDKEKKDAIIGSLAGKIFARFPEAHEITINFESIGLPNLTEYRAGVRTHWTKFYEVKYVRPS